MSDETIIVARGESIPKEDLDMIVQYLGRNGLAVTVKTEIAEDDEMMSSLEISAPKPPEPETLVRGPYDLDEISSEDHFLIREHFFEFGERFFPNYPRNEMGKVLGLLLRPSYRYGYLRSATNLDPAQFGLLIIDRFELGFGAGPPQTFSRGAVHVGSFLNFVENLDSNGGLGIWGLNTERKYFLDRLAEHLKMQITELAEST